MSKIYVLSQDLAFDQCDVDVRIKYFSSSIEKVENEKTRLCNDFDNYELEKYRKQCIEDYKNHPEWFEHETVFDPTVKRYVPWTVDLAVADYKRNFYESFMISELNELLDSTHVM